MMFRRNGRFRLRGMLLGGMGFVVSFGDLIIVVGERVAEVVLGYITLRLVSRTGNWTDSGGRSIRLGSTGGCGGCWGTEMGKSLCCTSGVYSIVSATVFIGEVMFGCCTWP